MRENEMWTENFVTIWNHRAFKTVCACTHTWNGTKRIEIVENVFGTSITEQNNLVLLNIKKKRK